MFQRFSFLGVFIFSSTVHHVFIWLFFINWEILLIAVETANELLKCNFLKRSNKVDIERKLFVSMFKSFPLFWSSSKTFLWRRSEISCAMSNFSKVLIRQLMIGMILLQVTYNSPDIFVVTRSTGRKMTQISFKICRSVCVVISGILSCFFHGRVSNTVFTRFANWMNLSII